MPPKVQLKIDQKAAYAPNDTIVGVVTISSPEFLRVKTLDVVLQCREYVGKEIEKLTTSSRPVLTIGMGSYEPQFETVYNITDHLRMRSRLRPEKEAEIIIEPIYEWSHLQTEPKAIDYSYKSEGCIIEQGDIRIPFELIIPELVKPPSLKTSQDHRIEWQIGIDLMFVNPRFPNIKQSVPIRVFPNPVVSADLTKTFALDTQYMLTFYPQGSKTSLRKFFGSKSSAEGEKILVTMTLKVPEKGLKQNGEGNDISLELVPDREGLELRIRKVAVLLEETVSTIIYGMRRTKTQEKKTYVLFQDDQINEESWQALPVINARLRTARCKEPLAGTFGTKNITCSYTMTVKVTVSTISRSEKTEMVISTPVTVYSYRAIYCPDI